MVCALMGEIRILLPKAWKVYAMTHRNEVLGEEVANEEKLLEDHTDIIVKGAREATFGHKVNLTAGATPLIIDCRIMKGDPSDRQVFGGVIERVKNDYGVVPRDLATDESARPWLTSGWRGRRES